MKKEFTFYDRLNEKPSGFTVLELLITLAAIAILAGVFVTFFNPDQFLKEKRDEKRLADLEGIKAAIQEYIDSGTGTINLGSANTVFVTNAGTVVDSKNQIISFKYICEGGAGSPNCREFGWLPIKFSNKITRKITPNFLADPRNSGNFVYTYTTDGEGKFKLTAVFESNKYGSKTTNDCGRNSSGYKIGTNCDLAP